MTEDNSDSRVGMGPHPALPDPAICRAKITVSPDLVDCLVVKPYRCPCAMNYGGAYFCNNPEKLEIVKHTDAARKKNQGRAEAGSS